MGKFFINANVIFVIYHIKTAKSKMWDSIITNASVNNLLLASNIFVK